METYLMMLYVTLDQESALKKFFDDQGWSFCKPDLSVTTDKLGPTIGSKAKESPSPVILGKRKAITSTKLAPKIKFVKIVSSNTGDVAKDLHLVSQDAKNGNEIEEEEPETKDPNAANDSKLDQEELDNKMVSETIIKEKGKENDSYGDEDQDEEVVSDDKEEVVCNDIDDVINNDLDDVGDEGNDDTDDSVEEIHDENTEEKLDGTSMFAKDDTPGQKGREVVVKNFPSQTIEDERDSDDSKIIETQDDVVKKLLSQSELQGPVYKCCICSKEIKAKYNMKRHLRTHLPDQINCNQCNRFFESNEKRDEHMNKRHSSRHICDTCGVSFKRKGDLNKHMIKHESVFNQETSSNCYKCLYKGCGKVFFRQTNYEYHLNVHSGVKPYECVKCLKPFHSKYTKNEHEKDCVNDVEYRCEICGSIFKQRSGLHNHTQAEHVRCEKGFPCEVCSQMFKFSSGLIRHKKEKHQLSDASQQTDTSEGVTSVKVKSESAVNAQTKLIKSTNNTAYIVLTDIEPESKNSVGSVKVANDVTVETSVVEEISESNTAEIITAMSESGEDINIERVIVVHQVASDMPQHLDNVTS